jgi:hypothetical protein
MKDELWGALVGGGRSGACEIFIHGVAEVREGSASPEGM